MYKDTELLNKIIKTYKVKVEIGFAMAYSIIDPKLKYVDQVAHVLKLLKRSLIECI